METKIMFGGLLEIKNIDDLERFLNVMSKNDSLKIIENSLIYSQKNGLFSFEESHVIYNCLIKLKENEKNNIPNNVLDDNTNGGID
jgi:hypothetical protein